MKIIWVKAGGLVPPDTGGKIRSYNILRELARKHSVTFFSFYGFHADDVHPGLKSVFNRVVCVPLNLPSPKSSREMREYLLGMASSEPYGISKFCRAEVRRKLDAVMDSERYDVLVCDFVSAAGVIPWNSPIPKVLFTHNVEATIWHRHYEVARNPLWKAVSWLEWKKMDAAERRYLRFADHVLTVSEGDRNAFASFLRPEKLTVIPTGVDVNYFHPAEVEERPNSLVFTGSMDWIPNEDAIFYFVESILPEIERKCPTVFLEVVGRKPSNRLKSLVEKRKNIRLTGWVEDIRPYLAKGSICIVPLRIGGGTRLKIFEAMAMAKAVVSTPVGAEGLPVRSGENILLAESPEDFAGQVNALMTDPVERKRLGAEARRLVEKNYSWEKVTERFDRVLQTLVSSRAS